MKITEVIKYEGDNNTFVWKHPSEDFNCLTQLIVHESQEAVFFKDGQALDLFTAGRYTLKNENIPILGKVLDHFLGGESPFHCEVYFINKTVQMAVKWGTDSKVRFIEPEYGVPLELGASGEMNLMVSDAKKLMMKVVGTSKGIAWSDSGAGFTKSLAAAFRPLISTAVKTHLSSCIKSNNINILEIDEHLELLSDVLRKSMLAGFEEYGLTIPEFYVTTVALPENDPNFKRIRELHTISLQKKMVEAETTIRTAKAESTAAITAAERQAVLERETTETEIARRAAERELIRAQVDAQKIKMSGFAEAEVMRAKGYTEKDVLQAEVQKAYAEGIGNMNISGGGVASDVLGLSVSMAAASVVAPQLSNIFKGIEPDAPKEVSEAEVKAESKCTKCGAPLPPNAKFCFECGEKVLPPIPEGMVICPECGATVKKGKFCSECGHKFVQHCPNCGVELAAGAKFCLECGVNLGVR